MVQWKRGTMACRGQYFRGAGVKLQSPSSAIQNPKTCTKQNQGLRLRLPLISYATSSMVVAVWPEKSCNVLFKA